MVLCYSGEVPPISCSGEIGVSADFEIEGRIVDLENARMFDGQITVRDGRIEKIEEGATSLEQLIMPGFVDSHVHIESSMLPPTEFGRHAVKHGTVATVSDPHEIANVLGVAGVDYMIEEAEGTPLKVFNGAPSCVPATSFETAGAEVSVEEVEQLLSRRDIYYLSEMMNYPGVQSRNPEVMEKIAAAHRHGKPVDGHAPGQIGENARNYFEAGITTDHECFTTAEGREKLELGVKVQIREGSAAKNFEALVELMREFPDQMMFCSDDKHPDDLLRGHINELVKRALDRGVNLFSVLRAASYTPVRHYDLPVGLLQPGDPADFIVVDSLDEFQVQKTFIDGDLVAEHGNSLAARQNAGIVNNFDCEPITLDSIAVPSKGGAIRVIDVQDGELVTERSTATPRVRDGRVVSDPESDVLKMVVVNRYQPARPAVAFVRNFGLREGALASSVAHDCHNIIAVGVDDRDIVRAVNAVIEEQGGISLASPHFGDVLPLPIAGLMSDQSGEEVARAYEQLDRAAKAHGSTLTSPYMTLSFLGLLVIPSLKLSDKGLFDGELFEFVDLFV
jgi:adenine deaminase